MINTGVFKYIKCFSELFFLHQIILGIYLAITAKKYAIFFMKFFIFIYLDDFYSDLLVN